MRLTVLVLAGFLSLPALAASADAPSPFTGAITALGTEPFWGLAIDPQSKTLWFHEDEESDLPANNYVAPVIGADGTATFTAKDFEIVLKVTGDCSDGMSDNTFPMSATVKTVNRTYTGCAYPRWDNDLLTLLPQIDSCLAAAKSKGPVTLATRTNAGVIVRVMVDDGTFECAFPGDSTRPGKAAVATDAAPMVSERDPLFYRAPGENPGGECFDAPEIRSADGKLIGWTMADEDC
ncbi:MAG: hypothetical protein IT548_15795 [Alphaproteobacteria bacterium]|nr:hypothetical protein [Alphaproteobacteria bacterium]